jgi:hypothetical protein
MDEEGGQHAEERDARARTTGEASGKESQEPGRRVHSRGDPARAGGPAWCAIHQAGHCDRPQQGPSRRCPAGSAAQGHLSPDPRERAQRVASRPEPAEALPTAGARGRRSAEARGASGCLADGAGEPRPAGRAPTRAGGAAGERQKSGGDEGIRRSEGGRPEGRADPEGRLGRPRPSRLRPSPAATGPRRSRSSRRSSRTRRRRPGRCRGRRSPPPCPSVPSPLARPPGRTSSCRRAQPA